MANDWWKTIEDSSPIRYFVVGKKRTCRLDYKVFKAPQNNGSIGKKNVWNRNTIESVTSCVVLPARLACLFACLAARIHYIGLRISWLATYLRQTSKRLNDMFVQPSALLLIPYILELPDVKLTSSNSHTSGLYNVVVSQCKWPRTFALSTAEVFIRRLYTFLARIFIIA